MIQIAELNKYIDVIQLAVLRRFIKKNKSTKNTLEYSVKYRIALKDLLQRYAVKESLVLHDNTVYTLHNASAVLSNTKDLLVVYLEETKPHNNNYLPKKEGKL